MQTETIPITSITKTLALPMWCTNTALEITFATNLQISGVNFSKLLQANVDYSIDNKRVVTLNGIQELLGGAGNKFPVEMSLVIRDIPKSAPPVEASRVPTGLGNLVGKRFTYDDRDRLLIALHEKPDDGSNEKYSRVLLPPLLVKNIVTDSFGRVTVKLEPKIVTNHHRETVEVGAFLVLISNGIIREME